MPDEPIASTAERTLRLVELLVSQPDGLTPFEIQARLGCSRSTLFLLLATLKQLGYVQQAERRGRYRPGPRLDYLRAANSAGSQDLVAAFYQEGGERSWAETLSLVIQTNDKPYVLAVVEGNQTIRCVLPVAQIFPDMDSVKVLLTNPPLDEVVTNGWAMTARNEMIHLALPICRDGIHPEAALVLSAPSFRGDEQKIIYEYLADLRVLAARLSYHIGAPMYTPFQREDALPLSPTTSMESGEIDAFLQGPWTARLACVRPNGQPHVIPVWHEWNGNSFFVIAWMGSQWAEYVQFNPNVSLSVDEPWPPLRRVVIQGKALPTEMELDGLIRRLTRRYLGSRTPLPADRVQVAFEIQPTSIRGYKGMPGNQG